MRRGNKIIASDDLRWNPSGAFVTRELTRVRTRLGLSDLTVRATAVELGLALVSGNMKHFERMSRLQITLEDTENSIKS
ncbi:MAG: hypothetical protein J7L91_00485 [Candidatus Korarchaeota archaeon]|nr:hypothetical protein [Candidatus Korarchaeota archaeon]